MKNLLNLVVSKNVFVEHLKHFTKVNAENILLTFNYPRVTTQFLLILRLTCHIN